MMVFAIDLIRHDIVHATVHGGVQQGVLMRQALEAGP